MVLMKSNADKLPLLWIAVVLTGMGRDRVGPGCFRTPVPPAVDDGEVIMYVRCWLSDRDVLAHGIPVNSDHHHPHPGDRPLSTCHDCRRPQPP